MNHRDERRNLIGGDDADLRPSLMDVLARAKQAEGSAG